MPNMEITLEEDLKIGNLTIKKGTIVRFDSQDSSQDHALRRPRFRIGDRVKTTRQVGNLPAGSVGTVEQTYVNGDPTFYLVNFAGPDEPPNPQKMAESDLARA